MEQLGKENYYRVVPLLKAVTINKLFAIYVLENKVEGRVYVDSLDSPKSCYIVHAYGMGLLFGDSSNREFNEKFRLYVLEELLVSEKVEWMQAYPDSWDTTLKSLFTDDLVLESEANQGKVELNSRVNFNFNKKKFIDLKNLNRDALAGIVRMDETLYAQMKGSVVPSSFWRSSEDFLQKGIGFCIMHQGKLASTAYSAFIDGNRLEIGIETVDNYRGNGYALKTCIALIDYCIDNNFEPVWACRLENSGSYQLAKKLGFEEVKRIPYYKLNN